MFKSLAQKSVVLLVREAEQSSGVLCAQDMLYCKNILESMVLKVKLPMLLKMDNKGAVDLANNLSVGGQTRHVDVRPKSWISAESRVQRMTQMCSLRILMDLHLKNALRLWLGRMSI